MADISSMQDESIDDSDEGVFEQSDSQSGFSGDYEGISIQMRIHKYASSSNIFVRQMAPRTVQDWFRTATVEAIEENLSSVMQCIQELSEQPRMTQDWLEQIPNIASQTAELADKAPILNSITLDYLLPIVIGNLGTSENIVNKAAQQALLELMRNKLISLPQVEIQVCPSILALSQDLENVAGINPSIVTLMSKMVRYLGVDVTERVFLKRYTELCSSNLFYVRRACASYFGDFAVAVRKSTFESTLLPCYIELCQDNISGVRGSCAQVAMYVSSMCSPQVRKTVLTPVFVDLLQDKCQWVRLSAFNAIGAFISTFADPSIIKLEYNEKGELIFATGDGNEYRNAAIRNIENILETYLNPCQMFVPSSKKEEFSIVKDLFWDVNDDSASLNQDVSSDDQQNCCPTSAILPIGTDENKENSDSGRSSLTIDNKDCDILDNKLCEEIEKLDFSDADSAAESADNADLNSISLKDFNSNECTGDNLTSDKSHKAPGNMTDNASSQLVNNNRTAEEDENLHLYNSYNYWYISPELPIEPNLLPQSGADDKTLVSERCALMSEVCKQEMERINEGANFEGLGDTVKVKRIHEIIDDQKVVPQILINHFISMTDPEVISNFHSEMTYQCAYSLPAVVLTLGSENWHLLKHTVSQLAADKQYKVRRTVAGYLHELAHILGPELASSDLTHLFDDFIKDLDVVRIEVLKHLAEFLSSVNATKRSECLPRIADFLLIDHQWNWRFREELAKQLSFAVVLLKPYEVTKFIAPIAQELLCDNVAAVRQAALLLVTQILKFTAAETIMNTRLLVKLAEGFAHSMKWKRRQMFALLCCELLRTEALKPERFANEVMPHLLDLSWDPVANVRLVVARAIVKHILVKDYFADSNNQYGGSLDTVLQRLQADKDRDVRQATFELDDRWDAM